MTIKRVWHGWTTPGGAAAYEQFLRGEVFPEIASKRIPGYRGIELLRRNLSEEVEFITIMTFDSLAHVAGFAGPDYERAHVPEGARAILLRWDSVSAHYEVLETATGRSE